MTKFLIAVVGPTAIGKTTLAIQLAKHFKTEIISSDSRQFYKEMSIGTAAPSNAELAQATHHFIKNKSITNTYTVGDFEREAIEKIKTLHKKHQVVIMVGGSGLYTNAVTKGLDTFPEVDKSVRDNLNLTLKTKGLKVLQNKLEQLDPKAFKTIAIDNPQRVIRALEICLSSQKPYSSFLTHKNKLRAFKTITIGLHAERSVIYERINKRVDLMMQAGLLKEVTSLLPYKHLNALNTVGYKELFKYLEGEWSMDFAISEIKKNTRRFAKRQLTWYRKDEHIHWFNYNTDVKDIIKHLVLKLNQQ